ncbi:MAG: COX15/CtaA family protein [Actinobacteria bacterium]|nr:COX15/CtaA family protein [Actinomycetota bacterium]
MAIDTAVTANPVGTWTRRIFALNIVAQCAIVVTGALVRLTASGLGCPTWPDCSDGSLVPVERQAEGFHKYIEFGNRMLTFALALIIVGALIAAMRNRPRRKVLISFAFLLFVGVAAQAVIGGITVLTGLNPLSVASHFLVSAVLIAVAVALYERGNESFDGPRTTLVRKELSLMARALVVVGFVIVVLGTVVTGSGPHSGDSDVVNRFPVDPRVVSWLHADVVMIFVGLSFALALGLRLTQSSPVAQRRVWVLIAIVLLQGLIGYTQYFTGVPELLVAVHVAGACAVWWATLRIPYALRERTAT